MLCDLLRKSDCAGCPESWFRPGSIPGFARAFGVDPNGDAYLRHVLRAGTDDTGVFGLRLMWDHLEDLLTRLPKSAGQSDAALITSAFGPTRYFFLRREDAVAQAVSRHRAEQTGLWHQLATEPSREGPGHPATPQYDGDQIARYVEEIRSENRAWMHWFAENAIVPTELTYERLASCPLDYLEDVLGEIGADPRRAQGLVPGTRKMADARSDEWASRFRRERRGTFARGRT